ncbi:MAG: hypothetical protein R3D62_19710 [Xanthobacteraceae bacterium]
MNMPSSLDTPGIPSDDGKQLALLNYILYFVGFFTGVTAVVGVIIAYLKRSEAAGWVQTHFIYQIRTFWIGLLWLVLGGLASVIFIGFLLMAWWFVWTLVRCIKGVMRLNDNRPIEDPLTWIW